MGRKLETLALLAAASLFIGPALAASNWTPYGNARFGYWVSVPPDFACGPEADDSDGKTCTLGSGQAKLAVWGGYAGVVDNSGFAGEVAFDLQSDEKAGLVITYRALTPKWASYSGTENGRIVYVRMISACGGSQYAAFHLDYDPAQSSMMKPEIGRLVSSLKQETCN